MTAGVPALVQEIMTGDVPAPDLVTVITTGDVPAPDPVTVTTADDHEAETDIELVVLCFQTLGCTGQPIVTHLLVIPLLSFCWDAPHIDIGLNITL